MATNPAVEIMRVTAGVVGWGPAIPFGPGALALVDLTTESGARTYSLMLLDASGAQLAASEPLPLLAPHLGGALVATANDKALVVVLDRKTQDLTGPEFQTRLTWDQPRWFSCALQKGKLLLKEIDFWEGFHASEISATGDSRGTTWTMSTGSYHTEPKVEFTSRLAYGFATGSDVPTLREIESSCTGVAHARYDQQSMVALVNAGYREIQLWLLGAEGEPRQLPPVNPPEQRRGEVSEPAVLPLSDGYALVWRYFNGKTKRDERDGGLWFRTCDLTLGAISPVQRLAEDREIPAGVWRTVQRAGSCLIVWGDGMSLKNRQFRCLRLRALADLSRKATAFPGDVLPGGLVQTADGLLTLSTRSSMKPYYWSLETRLLPDTF